MFVILTIPFLIYGKDIFVSVIKKTLNMDTLVTIGVFSSFSYSIFSTIIISIDLSNNDLDFNIIRYFIF